MYDVEVIKSRSYVHMARISFGLGYMLIGSLLSALALWLATVYQYVKWTGLVSTSHLMSQFSMMPMYGTLWETTVETDMDYTHPLTGPIWGRDVNSLYASYMSEPGATIYMSRMFSDDDSDPLPCERVYPAEDAQRTSETLYNDVLLLGLNSYDFQFGNISISGSMFRETSIFEMQYGTFLVFSLREDHMKSSRRLVIAPRLYDMMNHAYQESLVKLNMIKQSIMTKQEHEKGF